VTRRVALAVNPTAGRGRGAAAGSGVAAVLARHGVDVVMVAGGGAAEVETHARHLLATETDTLVVVGGDGMMHLGTNVVAGTGATLGIVPAGTGNDIARDLGLAERDPEIAGAALVEALEAGSVRAVDAVRCPEAAGPGPGGTRWFAGVLGAGFDALVNERANGWRWPRGHLRYDLAILRELPVLKPRGYVLDLDGETWTTAAAMVAVGNNTSYGGGMRVCPDALMDDGLLDVIVVQPLSRTAFVRLYPRVYRGAHVDDPRVTVRQVKRVRIVSEGIVGYADGERFGPLPLTCEVVPGALRVLVAPPPPEAAG
jgi:diacylglycerol kinase (ATP)